MTDTLLQAVVEVARLSGDVAARYYRTGTPVELKRDGSPVTEADRDAERTARRWLAERFPGEPILGEEFGGHLPDQPGRRWVLDPIDGTKSFVRGVPLWGTLVAVYDGPDVQAGAAYFPATGEMIAATRGGGCWLNDAPCRVSDVADLATATVLTTDCRDGAHPHARLARWQGLANRARVARTWGDAYGYLLVASGRAEVMVDPVANPWDIAPFVVIVEEAGGVITDWTGARTALGGDAVATNAALAREARAVLGVPAATSPAHGRP